MPSCVPSVSLTPECSRVSVLRVCKHYMCMCLFTPVTLLPARSTIPSPQLSILLAHAPWSCLGRVRKPEGTDTDASLLFWLLLTGVNCYHKAWRTAPYVSAVMWACLALRNTEDFFFSQNDQRFSPVNLLWDLGQSAISSTFTSSKNVELCLAENPTSKVRIA